MLAKKCDRCEKYYDFYKNNNDYNGIALTSFDREGYLSPNCDKHDLCPECMEKLIKFLGGENNKHDQRRMV